MVISLDYDISRPTALDYLKQHLAQILDITLADQVETKRKTEKALAAMSTLDDTTMADEEDAEDWAVELVADPNQEESNDAMQA